MPEKIIYRRIEISEPKLTTVASGGALLQNVRPHRNRGKTAEEKGRYPPIIYSFGEEAEILEIFRATCESHLSVKVFIKKFKSFLNIPLFLVC